MNSHPITMKFMFSYKWSEMTYWVILKIKNRPGCLFIRTFFTEEFLYPLTYVEMFETVCMKLYVRSRHAWLYGNIKLSL